jgi:hypothetical protein
VIALTPRHLSASAPNAPDTDALVTKLDAGGNPVWTRSIGANSGWPIAIATTPIAGLVALGHLVIAGSEAGAPASGGVLPLVLADYGPAGEYLWSQVIEGTGALEVGAVASDSQGNVVVAGSFSDSVTLASGATLVAPTGTAYAEAAFVAKYAANGDYQWGREYGGVTVPNGGAGPQAHIGALAIDTSGTIFLGGVFGGLLDFGSGPLTTYADGIRSVFLAAVDSTGGIIGAAQFPPDGDPTTSAGTAGSVSAVVLEPAGRLAIAGGYSGVIDFGGGPLPVGPPGCQQFGECTAGFVAVFAR